MIARGVLIKPWIFREAIGAPRPGASCAPGAPQPGAPYVPSGYWDITGEERLGIYRRYVELAREHWGQSRPELDDYGRTRLREFLRWHAGFWCRYAPRRADGTWPSMQQREPLTDPRSPLEALLSRSDDAALDYVADELLRGGDLADPPPAPAPDRASTSESDLVEAG
jgi:hypothetical protein